MRNAVMVCAADDDPKTIHADATLRDVQSVVNLFVRFLTTSFEGHVRAIRGRSLQESPRVPRHRQPRKRLKRFRQRNIGVQELGGITGQSGGRIGLPIACQRPNLNGGRRMRRGAATRGCRTRLQRRNMVGLRVNARASVES